MYFLKSGYIPEEHYLDFGMYLARLCSQVRALMRLCAAAPGVGVWKDNNVEKTATSRIARKLRRFIFAGKGALTQAPYKQLFAKVRFDE